MNKSITKEIVGLVKVAKHVGWGILNDHVLRAHRVLWPLERHGVAMSRRNVLRTANSIGAVWMKVEVTFKPFPLRSFACHGLLMQNNQMLWGCGIPPSHAYNIHTRSGCMLPYDVQDNTLLLFFQRRGSSRRWILRCLDCTHYHMRCKTNLSCRWSV